MRSLGSPGGSPSNGEGGTATERRGYNGRTALGKRGYRDEIERRDTSTSGIAPYKTDRE